jgi:disulfide bond formation protein DsbB
MNRKLAAIRSIGYVNLVALIYALLGMKAYGVSLVAVAVPPFVAIAGTIFYFTRWARTFPTVPKREGRATMSPYIMGASITVLALVLVYGLGAYAEFHQ